MPERRRLPATIGVLLVVLVGLVASLTNHPRPAPLSLNGRPVDHDVANRPVIVVGFGGPTWSDASPDVMPTLNALLTRGATGNLAVKAMGPQTCPTDGWATLSAGEGAGSRGCGVPTEPVPDGTGAVVPEFADIAAHSAAGPHGARLGLLAETLGTAAPTGGRPAGGGGQRAPVCVQAIGPGAALAAARPDGTVGAYRSWEQAAHDVNTLRSALRACPVTLVDIGSVRADHRGGLGGGRESQLRELDDRLTRVLSALPGGDERGTVVVAGLADENHPALHPVAVLGEDQGFLTSGSTRLKGIVQISDLTETVLVRSGFQSPASVGGRVLRTLPAGVSAPVADQQDEARRAALISQDTRSQAMTHLVAPYLVIVYGTLALCFAGALLAWRRARGASRVRLLRTVEVVALGGALVPFATLRLADSGTADWSGRHVLPVMLASTIAILVAGVVLVSLLAPLVDRSSALARVAAVAVTTTIGLTVDLATGSASQVGSVFGLQPLVGGRFYGMGNVAFTVYATCALVGNAWLARWVRPGTTRGRLAVLLVAVATLTVVIDAAPMWGNDVGGPLALVPAYAVFLAGVLGFRLPWRRWLAIGFGTVALVLALSFADHLRPPASRTHLGRFFDSLLDGSAGAILWRKLVANLELLVASPLLLVVGLPIVAAAVWLALRPGSLGTAGYARMLSRHPELRAAIAASLLCVGITAVLNDSGAAAPGVCAMVLVPLVVAATARSMMDEVTGDAIVPGSALATEDLATGRSGRGSRALA